MNAPFKRLSLGKRLSVFVVGCLVSLSSVAQSNQREINFNADWRFQLSDSTTYAWPTYNDKMWQTLALPHDWSIAYAPDSVKGEGCTAYRLGGVGWYRKHFSTPIDKKTQKVYLLFDGVYNRATTWINGRNIGFHPYGYSAFYYDISAMLASEGEDNCIAVRVDHSRYADSRWYSGSGIYRNVKLIVVNKLHIPIWGIFITTPKVTKEKAEVKIKINLTNAYGKSKEGEVITHLLNPLGEEVGQLSSSYTLAAGSKRVLEQTFAVEHPLLWEVDTPQMYTTRTEVFCDKQQVDCVKNKIGLRTFRFDADKGFFMNGKNMKIKGVCLHHCGGLVGAAVPKEVWRRRLQTLREGGCNAIRTSHNPPSTEFLNLCDEMGFLVQDEFYDEWDNPKDKRYNANLRKLDYIVRGQAEYFQTWAEKDLKTTMLRDRNHPCIIQWSIGNEIEWTYPRNKEATGFFGADAKGGYFWNQPPYSPERIKANLDTLPRGIYDIGRTAHKLARWTKQMDQTRPVIANCILPSVSFESGYIKALYMAGFSYRRVMYDYAKKHYPSIPIMGTENVAQWHEWKAIMERPFVAGTYLWTGIDYLGESTNAWPQRTSPSGLLDQAGFTKPSYFMMKSLWTEEPSIAIYTQTEEKSTFRLDDNQKIVERKPGHWKHALWHWQAVNEYWNYATNEPTIVEVYSNSEAVTLYLNGKSYGKQYLADQEDHIYKWYVPFKAGKLEAKGELKGKKISTVRYTPEAANHIQLTQVKKAEKEGEVYQIEAQLVDRKGYPVKKQQQTIHFIVKGDAQILGVDNGSPTYKGLFQTDKIRTANGHCLLIIKKNQKASQPIQIYATTGSLTGKPIKINVK